MSIVDEAMVELMMRLEHCQIENAKAFVVVTVDAESGDVVNAQGPFEQAEIALVQAAKDDADWKAHAEPGEGDFKHVVVPLWEPS